jgi:cytosine/uracil/thiamine/allantoin permease
VIVQKEPDECQIKDIHHASLMNDNYITLSVILSILSICTGCLPALCFSIPAIVYAVQARQAHAIGDFERMRSKEKSAFAMNIFVLLFWIVAFTLITVITYSAKCGFDGIYCNTAPREAV